MNATQLERANKAHSDYLALLERRKNPPELKAMPKPCRKPKPRWPIGSPVWVPSVKSEGKVLEAVSDVLGDWTYLVEYWGHLKAERKELEEHQLEDLDLS